MKYLGPAEKAGSWDKVLVLFKPLLRDYPKHVHSTLTPSFFLKCSPCPDQECLHLCESSNCRCEGQRGVKRIWLQLSRISHAFSVKVSWRHRKLFTVPPVGLKSHCWEPIWGPSLLELEVSPVDIDDGKCSQGKKLPTKQEEEEPQEGDRCFGTW